MIIINFKYSIRIFEPKAILLRLVLIPHNYSYITKEDSTTLKCQPGFGQAVKAETSAHIIT